MRVSRFCIFLLGFLFMLGVADAKPKKLTQAEQQFNEFVKKATESFQLQNYEAALKGYEEAYKIDPVPALQLAMGQCYRSLNNYGAAITSYQTYLTKAGDNAADKKAVEDTIRELERLRAQGTLDFSTDPSDAQLYIDGKLMGNTPISVPGIDPGEHKIKLVKEGYAPIEKTFNFAPGQRQSIGTSMEPLPGFLEVGSTQDPVSVFINGAFAGVSPFQLEMRSGEYLFQYKKEKFQTKQEKQSIQPGQTTRLEPVLEPGKGNIEVQINLKDADVTIGKLHKKTDETGKAVFTDVPAGKHNIQISKPPFQDSTQTIDLESEETEVIQAIIKGPPLPKLLYGASAASFLGAGVLGGISVVSEQNDGPPVGRITAFALAGTWFVSGSLATVLYVRQRVNKITESREMKKDIKDKEREVEETPKK
jgi:hypothetical protein